MSRRGISLPAILFLLASFVTGLGVAGAPTASAASPSSATIAFDSFPQQVPGNLPSVGYEATSTSEFGDYATFANNPPNTHLESVDVLMSSWGCQSGHWYSGDCSTTDQPTFSHPITLTIYNNDGGDLGLPVATETQTFDIPFRPSADNVNCTGDDAGKWFDPIGGKCYNGFATPITFDFSSQSVVLPQSAIYSVSYSTTHYGAAPIGESAPCFSSDAGCGYDSLNVAVGSTEPSVGTDDGPDSAFLNSSSADSYCDGGSGGTGAFRLDAGCWTDFNPNVRFHVEAPDDPTDLAQADHNSASMAVGDLTDTGTINFSGTVSEPDSSDVGLQIEVKPFKQAFDGTGTSTSALVSSGGTATATATGLADGRYHWRARTVDGDGFVSAWVSFGGNSDGDPPITAAASDLRVNAPGDPTTLQQLKPNDDPIAPGGTTDGQGGLAKRSVQLRATTSDPDGQDVRLRVQLAPTDEAFGPSSLTQTSPLGPAGTATFTFGGLTADSNYHWRAETIDGLGFESHWVSFGGNSDGDQPTTAADTDFRVPQADLSVTKTQSATPAATCPNPTQSYLCVLAGRNLTYSLSVTNTGPDDASNVQVTDTLPTRTTYVSASGSGWSCGHVGLLVTCTRSSLTSSTAPDISVVATAKASLRHGPLTMTNNAHVSSDVFDPDESSGGNDVSLSTEVHTVPEPPTKYDVQPGDTDAVVSWSAPVANEGAANGGEPIDFYRIVVTNVGSTPGSGTGTFDVYDPAHPGPAGTFVWTPCVGRFGGTFCFRKTGLTDDQTLPPVGPHVVYQFTIQAHNAVGLSDTGASTTATVTPSTNNKALIIPPTTSSAFGTCTTANAKNPICVQYQVPSGGGGVFSVQDTIKGYSTFDFSTFCGGPCTAGKGIGSFEGHPPAGYDDRTHPLVIIVTWDQTAWDGQTAHQNEVWYQADSLHAGVPFVLAKCTNPNVDTAYPDPCLKKTNILGTSKKSGGGCTASACFGDLQAQILLTSAADGGFSRH